MVEWWLPGRWACQGNAQTLPSRLASCDAAHHFCHPLAAGIPKLDDANDAGTKASEDCTLILTEGDSAKALAVAGLSVVGRNRYGVFPLRYGKTSFLRCLPTMASEQAAAAPAP